MDITFTINVDSWQRDLRYKKLVLMKRFRARLEKFASLTHQIVLLGVPKDTGNLSNAIKKNVEQDDIEQGLFVFTIALDKNQAPYWVFQEYGRSPGRAPYAKIRAWVQRKFGGDSKSALFITKGVMWKLLKVGFNRNRAPYHFMGYANENLNKNLLKRLLYEIDLDVKEVFSEATTGIG